jgi:IS605 OrfB family transposase
MIRSSQLNIGYSNKSKLDILDSIFEESKRVINLYIDELWIRKNFSSKFINFKVESWLSARMLQCLGKQALEIVKSQRKKKKKSKPNFNKDVINLDSRFVDIQFDLNSFDIWIKLSSIGNKISLNLPSKKHKHFHKYSDWKLKNSVRLRKFQNKYYIDFYFEKESPELKLQGKDIGLDCGYKKLLISSENKLYDTGLQNIYEKISRRKQGSKNFNQSLVERDNKINESINKLNFSEIKTIVVEDLKNVKHKSKGKIYKKFNNKLQRWSYSKVLNRLDQHCDETGITYLKVNPAYTSQTCSCCGFIHKNNRYGEKFLCLNCGYETDADYNASVNILHRGIYSSSTK